METLDPLLDPDIVCGCSLCIGHSTLYRGAGGLGVYAQTRDHMAWRYAVHYIIRMI
jgi:hypothetical protein